MVSDRSRQIAQWLEVSKQTLKDWLENAMRSDQAELVGLVINADYLKLLKIKSTQTGNEVEFVDVIKLPAGVVNKNAIVDVAAAADLLKKAMLRSNLKTKNIAIAIPRSSAMVKTITVDSRLTPSELESRVWMEANRLFPDLINDIYLDFAVAGQVGEEGTQIEVMIIACRKNQLQPYLEMITQAGLKPKVVDINYYALERVLPILLQQKNDNKTNAVLNISFSLINLLVIKDGKLIYSHEVNYDGSALFQLTNEWKENQDDDSEHRAHQITDALTQHLSIHLKHTMQFFYTSRPNVWIDCIYLSDDCAAEIPGLADFIRGEVNKEIELANPFVGMKISPDVDVDKLNQYAPALLLSCGVALSKVR